MTRTRHAAVKLTEAEIRLVIECVEEFTSANAYDASEYRLATGNTAADFKRLVVAERKLRNALGAVYGIPPRKPEAVAEPA